MPEIPHRRWDDTPENINTRLTLVEADVQRLSGSVEKLYQFCEKLVQVSETDRNENRELTCAMKLLTREIQLNSESTTKQMNENTINISKLQRTVWVVGSWIGGGAFVIGLGWNILTTLIK